MSNLRCQAILFDLDGTLVDSVPRVERLWLEWGKRRGLDIDYLMDVMHGRQAEETIRIVAPHLSAQDEYRALEVEDISDMAGVQPYASAVEMVSQLSPQQWAIDTSGTKRVAEARMRHVRLPRPEILITADEIQNGKPAPDGYLLAASRLHRNPSDCIVVEDSPAGIQAGKSAGMRVIAVASTHSLATLQADAAVQHLSEIKLQVLNQGISIQIP